MSDKTAIYLMVISTGLGVLGVPLMLALGFGYASLIPLVIPVAVAEFVGKARNGV